jgi:hypothetical protein
MPKAKFNGVKKRTTMRSSIALVFTGAWLLIGPPPHIEFAPSHQPSVIQWPTPFYQWPVLGSYDTLQECERVRYGRWSASDLRDFAIAGPQRHHVLYDAEMCISASDPRLSRQWWNEVMTPPGLDGQRLQMPLPIPSSARSRSTLPSTALMPH